MLYEQKNIRTCTIECRMNKRTAQYEASITSVSKFIVYTQRFTWNFLTIRSTRGIRAKNL